MNKTIEKVSKKYESIIEADKKIQDDITARIIAAEEIAEDFKEKEADLFFAGNTDEVLKMRERLNEVEKTITSLKEYREDLLNSAVSRLLKPGENEDLINQLRKVRTDAAKEVYASIEKAVYMLDDAIKKYNDENGAAANLLEKWHKNIEHSFFDEYSGDPTTLFTQAKEFTKAALQTIDFNKRNEEW